MMGPPIAAPRPAFPEMSNPLSPAQQTPPAPDFSMGMPPPPPKMSNSGPEKRKGFLPF
jgi:hypothetical protein